MASKVPSGGSMRSLAKAQATFAKTRGATSSSAASNFRFRVKASASKARSSRTLAVPKAQATFPSWRMEKSFATRGTSPARHWNRLSSPAPVAAKLHATSASSCAIKSRALNWHASANRPRRGSSLTFRRSLLATLFAAIDRSLGRKNSPLSSNLVKIHSLLSSRIALFHSTRSKYVGGVFDSAAEAPPPFRGELSLINEKGADGRSDGALVA
mmetsp:Transcript_37559/g.120489  ORF Transcript_37559/g.120489 Transcript_37559/m.120489 type:complete len:213 (-) Transcript_37559:42-680(-)